MFTRIARLALCRRLRTLLVTALVPVAIAAAPAASAQAYIGGFAAGTFSCPGNTMVLDQPTMNYSAGGITGWAGGRWEPFVQTWNGSQWVNYTYHYYFEAYLDVSGNGAWKATNGYALGGPWSVTVQPGYWSGGVYHYRYYRFVNYYQWVDHNDQPITGWYSAVSHFYNNSASTMCAF